MKFTRILLVVSLATFGIAHADSKCGCAANKPKPATPPTVAKPAKDMPKAAPQKSAEAAPVEEKPEAKA